jgi:probable HAF family extracellular repeat protein
MWPDSPRDLEQLMQPSADSRTVDRLRIPLAGFIAILLPLHVHAAVYSILDLGILPNGLGSRPYGLNAYGQVVGGHEIEDNRPLPVSNAFRTDPNSPITAAGELGTLGGTYTVAFGINASGQTVGESYLNGNKIFHAFRIDSSEPLSPAIDLGTFGGSSSYAFHINDAGQAVGTSLLPGDASYHAFRTSPNGLITAASDLGTLPGGGDSFGTGVNSRGQAVGFGGVTALLYGRQHAFRTEPNGPITANSDLGTLGDGDLSRATGINESGQVVGLSWLDNGVNYSNFHAFRYDGTPGNGGIMHDLGTLGGTFSEAHDINASGQTVGNGALPANLNVHASLTDMTGPMRDLNDLIPANTGWELYDATGINDNGQITGWGFIHGLEHGFLLTPTPEPASLVLVGVALTILMGRHRHSGQPARYPRSR